MNNKQDSYTRIEFWASITIFVFVVFFFITDGLDVNARANAYNKFYFEKAGVRFNYYEHYFFPRILRYILLFPAFLFLNFIVIPKLWDKLELWKNVSLIVGIYIVTGLVLGVTDTYLRGYLYAKGEDYEATEQMIFGKSFLYGAWLFIVLAFYSVIKYVSLYLLENAEAIRKRYKMVNREGLAAFVVWMICMFLLMTGDASGEIIGAWATIVPFGIVLYCFSIYALIPQSLNKKKPFLKYILKVALIVIISYLPVALILLLSMGEDDAFAFSFFNSVFQLLITAPLSWVLFKRQMKGNEEIYVLKKELGRSNANFDFLRSQINPHFLFNALNTIYGTAIQEKAERTSEGIEKLGDMMRFMLQENMQEKISLAREIEYLNNYIALQKLRTDPNPCIKIEADIPQEVQVVQIAPMLLIPFVENAFKHGISFREPSHIKVSLEIKNNKLYFDVYNSRHVRHDNDPEKDKSGIGLNNVRQRLQLLYAGKHELIIRETGKEFFVHLTMQLS